MNIVDLPVKRKITNLMSCLLREVWWSVRE